MQHICGVASEVKRAVLGPRLKPRKDGNQPALAVLQIIVVAAALVCSLPRLVPSALMREGSQFVAVGCRGGVILRCQQARDYRENGPLEHGRIIEDHPAVS
jgi:hypothetical protein